MSDIKVENIRFDKERSELIVSFDSDKHYAINILIGDSSEAVSNKLLNIGNMIRFETVEAEG